MNQQVSVAPVAKCNIIMCEYVRQNVQYIIKFMRFRVVVCEWMYFMTRVWRLIVTTTKVMCMISESTYCRIEFGGLKLPSKHLSFAWPLFWSLLIPSFSLLFILHYMSKHIYSIHDMFLFYRCLAYTCNTFWYTYTRVLYVWSKICFSFAWVFFSFSSTSFPSSLFLLLLSLFFHVLYIKFWVLSSIYDAIIIIWAAFSMCNSSIYSSYTHTCLAVGICQGGTTCYIFLLQFLLSVFLLYFCASLTYKMCVCVCMYESNVFFCCDTYFVAFCINISI